jgi:phospholipase C
MSYIGEDSVSPQWTSGDIADGEYTEDGCHEYITATACSILINDKGFYANNATASVVIALSISLASLLPDRDEVGLLYAGHFYDPSTGKNCVGSTTNTAKVHAQEHYDAAVNAANVGAMDEAYEHLGRCLHYVQDASEPHHAANNRHILDGLSHGRFEDFAYSNQETYLGSYTSISNSCYTIATNSDISTLVDNTATFAKQYINTVNNTDNQTQWSGTAEICLKNAAKYSAMVMYRFSRESAVPFY